MNDSLGQRGDLDPSREMSWDTTLLLADGSREPWHYRAQAHLSWTDDEFTVKATSAYQHAKAEAQRRAGERH